MKNELFTNFITMSHTHIWCRRNYHTTYAIREPQTQYTGVSVCANGGLVVRLISLISYAWRLIIVSFVFISMAGHVDSSVPLGLGTDFKVHKLSHRSFYKVNVVHFKKFLNKVIETHVLK
jgi:hypothetical protein